MSKKRIFGISIICIMSLSILTVSAQTLFSNKNLQNNVRDFQVVLKTAEDHIGDVNKEDVEALQESLDERFRIIADSNNSTKEERKDNALALEEWQKDMDKAEKIAEAYEMQNPQTDAELIQDSLTNMRQVLTEIQVSIVDANTDAEFLQKQVVEAQIDELENIQSKVNSGDISTYEELESAYVVLQKLAEPINVSGKSINEI